MKTITLLIIFTLYYSTTASQTDETILIASCCEEGRGCNGSAYCTACKNCSGCKHCAKNGGSCGVCSSNRSYTRPKKTTTVKTSYTNSAYASNNYLAGQNLIVTSNLLNLRKSPNTTSQIIEKLSSESELKILEVFGSWLKVKVLKSNNVGYVYSRYVKLKQ